jgi:hypothetical protein
MRREARDSFPSLSASQQHHGIARARIAAVFVAPSACCEHTPILEHIELSASVSSTRAKQDNKHSPYVRCARTHSVSISASARVSPPSEAPAPSTNDPRVAVQSASLVPTRRFAPCPRRLRGVPGALNTATIVVVRPASLTVGALSMPPPAMASAVVAADHVCRPSPCVLR